MPHRPLLLVLATALLAGLAFQGTRGLYDSTEGRYALCSLEMLRSGHWLEPTLLGEPHWTKPPLAYWSIAGGIALFGPNARGARLANALFFTLTALIVALLARRLWDEKTGLLAGLVYATSPYAAGVAFSISTDTLVTLWETLAVFCFWSADRTAARPRLAHRWQVAMWIAFAFGFLTKGPPALMTLIPVVVYRALDPDRRAKPRLFSASGLLSFAVIAFSWYLYVSLEHAGLLRYFLGDEILRRVATTTFHRNPEWHRPFTLYLPLLLLGGGLWSWFVWRGFFENHLYRLRGWRRLLREHGPKLFLVAWVSGPLLIFSLSRSRMIDYVLPLYPALALAAARQARKSWPSGPLPRRLAALAAVSLILVVSGKAVSGIMPPADRDMGALYELCRTDDLPGKTSFVFFEQRKRFGFRFYAKSEVIRTDRRAREGVHALKRYLSTILKRDGPAHAYVFICERKTGPELETRLREQASFPPDTIRNMQSWGDENWSLTKIVLPP